MKQIKSKKGFTLIELLIVIAVISIIVGIALPRFKGIQDEGNIIRVKGDLRTLQTAVESFYIHNSNAYPRTGSNFSVDLLAASPQIISVMPKDPYNPGNSYGYDLGGANDQSYVIFSEGTLGTGSAAIDGSGNFTETNGASCIYVSNIAEDIAP